LKLTGVHQLLVYADDSVYCVQADKLLKKKKKHTRFMSLQQEQ
jgi:hypothetical protein